MEFVEGKTVKDIIKNSKLKIKNVVDYAIQIAEALQEAHEHNIIHRDIKSENIKITPKGLVKVMDFGLAKMPGTVTKTQTGTTMGTIAYMSPEQTKGEHVDFRTDIWSLGVVLYEMLTGELPFKGDYDQAVIYSILNEEPEKISVLRPDVPAALEQIVYQALTKKREERFATAQDIMQALHSVVESKPEQHTAGTDQTRIVTASSSTKRKKLFVGLTLVILLAAVAFTIKTLRERFSTARTTITCLTSYEREEASPALSADGTRLAYSWRGMGTDYDIYLKSIGEEGHQQFTDDSTYEFSAAWSPDANALAFVRCGDIAGIYHKAIWGGRETKVADISMKWGHPDMMVKVDWSPDGQWLVFNDYDSTKRTNYLYRFNLDSGERDQITFSEPGIVGDMGPKFSPDGKRIAFIRAYGHRIREICILNLKNRRVKQLTFDKKQIDDLAWTSNGRKIVFVSSREGTPRLWSVGTHGGKPRALNIGGDRVSGVSIARRTNRLVYALTNYATDIWEAKVPEDAGLINPHKLIDSEHVDYFPKYSPDEQKIAFNSARTGPDEIYVCNRDGSNPVRITTLNVHSGVPLWSPDGNYFVFDSRPNGNSDILKIDTQGARPPMNLTNHPADERVGSWSNDGRYVYFCSNRSDAVYQTYRVSVEGGEAEQLTQHGGGFGFESSDGAYFYYKKFDDLGGPIYRIDLDTREESVAINELVSAFRWSMEKSGLYYIAGDENCNPTLKLFHTDTEHIDYLGTFDKWYNFWDVSNDGSHIMLWDCGNFSGDIYMVDHFR